jgi:hypothetical protein
VRGSVPDGSDQRVWSPRSTHGEGSCRWRVLRWRVSPWRPSSTAATAGMGSPSWARPEARWRRTASTNSTVGAVTGPAVAKVFSTGARTGGGVATVRPGRRWRTCMRAALPQQDPHRPGQDRTAGQAGEQPRRGGLGAVVGAGGCGGVARVDGWSGGGAGGGGGRACRCGGPVARSGAAAGGRGRRRPGSAGLLPVPGCRGLRPPVHRSGALPGVRSGVEVPWVVAVVSGMVRCHPG